MPVTGETDIEIADTPLALARRALAEAQSRLATTSLERKKAEKRVAECAALQEHLAYQVEMFQGRVTSLEHAAAQRAAGEAHVAYLREHGSVPTGA